MNQRTMSMDELGLNKALDQNDHQASHNDELLKLGFCVQSNANRKIT